MPQDQGPFDVDPLAVVPSLVRLAETSHDGDGDAVCSPASRYGPSRPYRPPAGPMSRALEVVWRGGGHCAARLPAPSCRRSTRSAVSRTGGKERCTFTWGSRTQPDQLLPSVSSSITTMLPVSVALIAPTKRNPRSPSSVILSASFSA